MGLRSGRRPDHPGMAQFPRRDYSGPPRRNRSPRPAGAAPARAGVPDTPASATAWQAQAGWYDRLQGDGGDQLYQQVLLPSVLRRLAAPPGSRVLDVGCGQGVLGRALAQLKVESVGIDASPALIEAAQKRAGRLERHRVGDARRIGDAVAGERFDHAALVMVLQDLDALAPVLSGTAAAVKPGGRVVIAMTHPCFRQPKRSSWSWDDDARIQYRRIDGYLSEYQSRIATHPGAAPGTAEAEQATLSTHRPLSAYLDACGQAGLGVVGCDELCNPRRGTRGQRFAAEDRAAKEIPLFLVLTAVRLG